MDQPAPTGAQQLDRAWGMVRRRWRLGALALLVPLAAVVGLVPFLPSVYRASSVVLVERQQVPEALVKSTVTSALDTRLQMITQEILRRGHLQELIERFDLYPELRRRSPGDAVLDRVRRDIHVDLKTGEPLGRTNGTIVAFTVSYTGRDPRTVADVANTIASYYLSENSRVREQEASGTAAFLRRQLAEVKDRLEAQEARLSAFKRRYIGENPKNMDANLAVLERLTSQLRLNSDNQNRALARREMLARQLAENDGTVPVAAPGLPEAGESPVMKLARLRQELAELRTRFSDRYPDVVRLKADIAALEAHALAARPAESAAPGTRETIPNPYVVKIRQAIAEVDAEVIALRAEERRLREDFATYQRRVENTPLREQEFQELSRDYDTTGELYRTLLKRYEEAQLAETLEQRQKGEQFRILEAAVPPRAPAAPNRLVLFLFGTALAAGLAVGAMVLAEWLDTSFHDVDELRGFANVPVTGRIPPIPTRTDAARRRARGVAWACAAVLAMTITGGAAYATARGLVPGASQVAQALLLRN